MKSKLCHCDSILCLMLNMTLYVSCLKEYCNLVNVRLIMYFCVIDLCVGLLVGINPFSLELLDGKTTICHQPVGRYCFSISSDYRSLKVCRSL
jgi:hypothetical protein